MAIEITEEDKAGGKTDSPEMDTVTLVGEGPYEFYFPKVGAILSKFRRAAVEAKNDSEKGERYYMLQMDWLERGFGPEQWQEITDRLEDEDDLLEDAHLQKAFELLMKAATGRPTTSPNGSSRQRSVSKRKAAPSRQDSDSETSTLANSAT